MLVKAFNTTSIIESCLYDSLLFQSVEILHLFQPVVFTDIIIAGSNMMPYLNFKGTNELAGNVTSLGIITKTNDADMCTAVDIKNERLITLAIQTAFPHHLVIGEESTGTGKPDPLTINPTWIIDPIDG